MCELTTALAIASAASTAIGSFSEASAAKQQARAQSQIAANNAIIASNNAQYQEERAKDSIARGATEANQRRRQIAQLEGSQRAAYSGAGVVLDSGSPLDVFNDTITLGNEDINTIKKNSESEAMGYRMNAYNYRAGGATSSVESSLYGAKADSINPYVSAASSALSSASTISSKWDSFSAPTSTNYYSSGYYNPGTYNAQAAGDGLPWSDVRLKHSIEQVGEYNGIPVYEFSYVGNKYPGRYVGVMADDVEHIPGAVVERGGFKSVHYPAVGLEFCEVAGHG